MNLERPIFAFVGAKNVGKSYYWAAAYNCLSQKGFGFYKVRTESAAAHKRELNKYVNYVQKKNPFGRSVLKSDRYKVSHNGDFDSFEHSALRTFEILQVPGRLVDNIGEDDSNLNKQLCATDGLIVFFDAQQIIEGASDFEGFVDTLASKALWRLSKIENDPSGGKYPFDLGNESFPIAIVITKCDDERVLRELKSSPRFAKIKEFASFFQSRQGCVAQMFFISAMAECNDGDIVEPLLFVFGEYLREFKRQCIILSSLCQEYKVRLKEQADKGLFRSGMRFLFGSGCEFPETEKERLVQDRKDEIEDLAESVEPLLNSLKNRRSR